MTATHERNETFEVEDDHLIRKVVPLTRCVSLRETGRVATDGRRPLRRVKGEPYEHRCPRSSFEQIAHAAEELGEHGFTLESLVDYERQAGRDVTFTNVAVALAFLRERSILDVRHRWNYAATQCAHLDAMIEFYALAENACLRRQG